MQIYILNATKYRCTFKNKNYNKLFTINKQKPYSINIEVDGDCEKVTKYKVVRHGKIIAKIFFDHMGSIVKIKNYSKKITVLTNDMVKRSRCHCGCRNNYVHRTTRTTLLPTILITHNAKI